MLLLCWHNNVNTFFFAIVFGIPPHANLMRTYSLPRPMVPHLQQLKPKTLNKKTIYYHYRYVKIYYHVYYSTTLLLCAGKGNKRHIQGLFGHRCHKNTLPPLLLSYQKTHHSWFCACIGNHIYHCFVAVVPEKQQQAITHICMNRKPHLVLLLCCCCAGKTQSNNHTHRCRLVHGRAETHSGAVIEVQ